jgi:hypothetical protein
MLSEGFRTGYLSVLFIVEMTVNIGFDAALGEM